jgi:DNA-binding MarR family transcriptional regulator
MSKAEELAASIVHHYLTLVRFQRYMGERTRSATNVSGRQVAVLRRLLQEGPCTVGQIGGFLYVRDAPASGLVDRLDKAGHVTRHRCEQDNRRVIVELTESGRLIAQQAPVGMVGLLRARLPELSEDKLKAIDNALVLLCDLASVDETVLD